MKNIRLKILDKKDNQIVWYGDIYHLPARFKKKYRYEFLLGTGLHDKLGKEIFEGDILKWDVPSVLRKGYQNPRPETMLYVCEWDDALCRFRFKSKHKYPNNEDKFIFHVSYDLTIIGSIYENPELLES